MTEAERLAERLEELLTKANLPWRVQKEALPNRVGVTAANHEFITWAMENGWKANLIVEAVNALPALITAIRSQAEELERLRGALGELSDYETDRASMWADQHNEWTKDEMHKIARAALGER